MSGVARPFTLQHRLMRMGGMITHVMGTNRLTTEDVVTRANGLISLEQMEQIMLGKDPGMTMNQLDFLANTFSLQLLLDLQIPREPAPTPTPVTAAA